MSANTPSNGSSPEDIILQTIQQAEAAFASLWDSLTAMTPNLNHLPHEIQESLSEIYDKLTNQGTLPLLPSWRDSPVAWASDAPATAQVVATPPSTSHSTTSFITKHPFMFTFIAASGGLGTAYYFYPASTQRALRTISRRLPTSLSSLPSTIKTTLTPSSSGPRPARLIQDGHNDIRKEAVLLLGCDSPLLADLALDLESRGFVVIATVSRPDGVDALEHRSRGWMKVLVLDGNDATSVSPFLRSLATALSLRYPLFTSGDPFARPAHALALTSVVNGLAIDAEKSGLAPVEALDAEDVRRFIGEKVATTVGIIRGVVPILRSSAARPRAPQGVLLTLVPSTSSISLPYLSLASASDAAVSSLLTSLRRELHSTSSPSNIRVKSLSLGLFDGQSTSLPQSVEPSSTRISALYSTSLQTRASLLHSTRKGSSPKRLHSRVFSLLTRQRFYHWSPSNIGTSSWSNRVVSHFSPTWFVDSYLRVQNWLYTLYFTRRGASTINPPSYATATSSSRGPLPSLPSQHPPSLRPGFVPDSKSPPSPSASSEEGIGSGTEDLLSNPSHEAGSGMGSFVHVPSPKNNTDRLFRQEVRP